MRVVIINVKLLNTGTANSRLGATHGGDVGGLRAGIVAKRFLNGDAVLGQDAQVHHQRICFFVKSELGSRHKLVSLSDRFTFF